MAKTKRSSMKRKSGGPSGDSSVMGPKGHIWQPGSTDRDVYNVHKYRNYVSVLTIPANVSTGTTFGAQGLSLNQLSNYGQIANVYDQFRIDCWEVEFTLQSVTAAGSFLPRINVFPDFDNDTPPATLADVQSHPRLITHTFTPTNPTLKVRVSPRVAAAIYGPIASNYYNPDKPVWVDNNNSATKHYGIKYATENCFSTGVEVRYRVWLSARNPL